MKLSKNMSLVYFCFMIINCTIINGQIIERQVLGIGGGSSEDNSLYVSFTVGESIIGTLLNEDMALTQGFQQNEIKIPNALIDLENAPINIYPNPVRQKLFIQELEKTTLERIIVTNENGIIIVNEIYPRNELSTANWPVGVYFLYLIQNNKVIYKPFKLIKIE